MFPAKKILDFKLVLRLIRMVKSDSLFYVGLFNNLIISVKMILIKDNKGNEDIYLLE